MLGGTTNPGRHEDSRSSPSFARGYGSFSPSGKPWLNTKLRTRPQPPWQI